MEVMTEQAVIQLGYRPDARAVEALEAHLLRRLNSRIRDLTIVAQMDGLVLKGRVRTYYEKQLAQHALMEVSSTPIVSNDIEVESCG
jgi:hypothetical protein